MPKVLLQVQNKHQQALLEVEQATSPQIDRMIDGLFHFFSISVTPKEMKIEHAISEEKTPTVTHVTNNVVITKEPSSMEEALEEIEKKEQEIPSYYNTGIKVKNGINHYRCRYRCPKCNNTGNHYIPEGVKMVDCHECQTTMLVKKATPGTQGIQPDRFKNWFVAGEQLPVEEFVYGKAISVQ